MLYFSSRPIDPCTIDLEQHKKLKEFKETTTTEGPGGGFRRVDELRADGAAGPDQSDADA